MTDSLTTEQVPPEERAHTPHSLKTWPAQFAAVLKGEKAHEVRRFDRDFRVGDDVFLYEFDPETEAFSGEYVLARIRYITAPGSFGLPPDIGVFTIKKISSGGTTPTMARDYCNG